MKIKLDKDILLCLLFSAFLLLFLFIATSRAGPYFGEFGTSTETDDTCYLCFSTFDTLGNSANAVGDSVYYIRLIYNGTLLDSTYGGTKVRNYTYCLKIKAYDGTNLGQYTVDFFWRPCIGRWYNDIGTYIVKPETTEVNRSGYSLATSQTFSTSGSVGRADSVVAVNRLWDNKDTTNYVLASSQTFSTSGAVGSVTAGVTVTTNNDKTGYSLLLSEKQMIADTSALRTWNYGTRAITDKAGFSLLLSEKQMIADTSALRTWNYGTRTITDKAGFSLSNTAYGILGDTVWKKDTTDYRLATGKMGEYLVHKTGAGASASDIWTWQGTITLKDTLRLQGSASGLTAAGIWSYSTRTLTSDFAQLRVSYRTGVYGVEDSVQTYVLGVLKSTEKNYWYGFRLDSARVVTY